MENKLDNVTATVVANVAKLPKEYKLKVLDAISSFTEDLWVAFGDPKQASPLALYRRLLSRTKERLNSIKEDENFPVEVDRFISGHENFSIKYDSILLEGNLKSLHEDAKIKYGDSPGVYLNVGKFVRLAMGDENNPPNEGDLDIIFQHLFLISTVLDATDDKLKLLREREAKKQEKVLKIAEDGIKTGIDTSTKEGAFLENMMNSTVSSLKNMGVGDPNAPMMNPMEGIASLMQGGIIQNMMNGLKDGADNNQFDMRKMAGAMKSMIQTTLLPMIDTLSQGNTMQNSYPKDSVEGSQRGEGTLDPAAQSAMESLMRDMKAQSEGNPIPDRFK